MAIMCINFYANLIMGHYSDLVYYATYIRERGRDSKEEE
jgi:hypothetical protein